LDKAPDAFRTISEVADEIDVPQHVLRFWESRFTQIKPMKRGGGRRYYRPDDVDLLRGIRHLLYGEGYTIRGVQRILRDEGAAFVQDVWRVGAAPPEGEDDEAGEFEATAEGRRSEPDLSALGLPPRGSGGRSAAAAAGKAPAGEVAEQLRLALGELMACRRLIDAALSETDTSEQNGRSAEI
jgi:DNA-binding transcriptional MerR regulator